jgi:hypothetical protein
MSNMKLDTEVSYGEDEEGLIYAYFWDKTKNHCFSLSRFVDADEIEIMVYDQINELVDDLDVKISKGYLSASISNKLASKLDGNREYIVNYHLESSNESDLQAILNRIFLGKRGLSVENS